MTAMVEARSSVYYLSCFLQFLQSKTQGKDLQNEITQPLHQDQSDKAEARKSKILNHLSALFSRGRAAGEGNRVVAVAAGPVLLNAMDVIVGFGSTSPAVTTSTSNTTVLGTLLPGVSHTTIHNPPKIIIPAGENFDDVLLCIPTDNRPLPFAKFVEISVRLLRAGGARLIGGPRDDHIRVHEKVTTFFVEACFSKLDARFAAVKHTYGELNSLADWTSNESVASTMVAMNHPGIQNFLKAASILSTQTPSGICFTFDYNASLWWRCLVEILISLEVAITARDSVQVASITDGIHTFLQSIPPALWQIEGLRIHLRRLRLANEMNQAKKVEHEESTADALPEDSDNNLPAEARAFVSAVDAVCAWTTGAKYLLKSEITKSPAPLIISLLDLPRGDIKESTPNALLNRWQSVASELWSNDNQDIAKKLREFQAEVEAEVTEAEVTEADKAGKKKARVKERKAKTESAEAEAVSAKAEATEATTTEATSAATEATTTEAAKAEAAKADAPIPAKRGQCHCEAALISSIYLRRKDLNDLPAEKREPTVVASAFKNFSPDMSDSFTVGVAKKCCPICKLVVTALRGWQIDLNISGAHSRYHPWVPPQWLPDDIIIELEIELIKRVSALLVRPSRASSPTGDSDKASIHIYPEKFPKPPKATRK